MPDLVIAWEMHFETAFSFRFLFVSGFTRAYLDYLVRLVILHRIYRTRIILPAAQVTGTVTVLRRRSHSDGGKKHKSPPPPPCLVYLLCRLPSKSKYYLARTTYSVTSAPSK